MSQQLGEAVWRIEGSAANVFLTVDHAAPVDEDDAVRTGDDGPTGALVLVDAGTPGDADTIRRGVESAGFAVGDVSRVLLTHYDYDHVGALSKLDELSATVYAHEPDASFLDGSDSPGLWPHKALLQRATARFLDTPGLSVERVRDGDTVGSYTAYHTPGHGPGHLAWVSETARTAFLGDLVRESGGQLSPSPWLVSYDTDAVRDSVGELARRAPSFDTAGVGHGAPLSSDADEALAALATELSNSPHSE
ncbi:MBL fold metallo-hydrolase [Halobaculum sp. MBLA0143]|uniref:MBL fold metallo-hydrolase n=1 Tax=Halobaculum sp. MBLA0143 TaxID=3079933 RepID=UPI0035255864